MKALGVGLGAFALRDVEVWSTTRAGRRCGSTARRCECAERLGVALARREPLAHLDAGVRRRRGRGAP